MHIKEVTELVKGLGEVVGIPIDRSLTGATKIRKLTIKTTDSEIVYDKMINALSKEKVLAGDVIAIEKTSVKSTWSFVRMVEIF
ncbi:hypothetical protein EV421DRAFT_1844467 [Armillaria borealis]|uniref:TIP49 P-loop domain-containing protein n=1 Tax=Armillaria borealis TaxID=47425 RepID=A0AA39J1E4_9AGAR|nr:hypothetical protein EV421DRAFT_1844467 [Armillaria borealis]